MDKEEILEKSRKENKNQDLYEKDVVKTSSLIGALVTAVLCAAFTIFELCIGAKGAMGFEAIIFTLLAAQFIYKAAKLKRKHEIACAVMYTLSAACFTVAYIISMVSEYCFA